MKRLTLLVGCAIFLLTLESCCNNKKDVEVITGKDRPFPDFLVGTWKAQGNKWGLIFDSDGSISLIRHPFVTVSIVPAEGGAYEQGRDGAYSIYVMGPCTARYEQSNNELNVEITIDYFEVVLPIGTVEGKMSDYFRGPISRDGTTWTAAWVSYAELVGAEKPDLNSIKPETVVFTRVQSQ